MKLNEYFQIYPLDMIYCVFYYYYETLNNKVMMKSRKDITATETITTSMARQ